MDNMNNVNTRYSQIVGLVSEAMSLSSTLSREQARGWFRAKEFAKDKGMLDSRVYTAFMRMTHSANGGFLTLEKMQSNLESFRTGVRMVEEQRPRTANHRVVVESRNQVLDNLVSNRMITGIVRHAVEDLYKLNSKVPA